MSKLLTGSIELTKIDKTKIVEKDGRKWLNIAVWLNDEKDKYGNVASIQISGKKDEPKIYIGNLKEYEAKPTPEAIPQQTSEAHQDDDNLPF